MEVGDISQLTARVSFGARGYRCRAFNSCSIEYSAGDFAISLQEEQEGDGDRRLGNSKGSETEVETARSRLRRGRLNIRQVRERKVIRVHSRPNPLERFLNVKAQSLVIVRRT